MADSTAAAAASPPVPLSQRVAIVTGGSGGMGPAIGAALARRGVGTIVFAQRGDASAAVAAVQSAGARALSLPLDVSSRAGVAAFFASFVASVGGRLDFLVNVAGAAPRTAVEDVDEAEMAATLAVNVTGPFWMCQAARPLMFASGGGAVVSVGSLAGEDGAFAASPAYSIAKAGLRGMMMHLAKNGFPGAPGADRATQPLIRVNNVSPGPVATAMLASMAPADLAKITAATLTGKVTTVEEVASAVVYLLLDAHNSTGQTLQLNGGVVRT
jgi:NAD(P)-dependent dehydrogenase (short-subunit alcohol dehydrogenase family)